MSCMSCMYTRLYAQFEILQMTCRLRLVHGMYRVVSLRQCSGKIAKAPAPPYRRPRRRLAGRRRCPVARGGADARHRVV
jgi:hypothetical protein